MAKNLFATTNFIICLQQCSNKFFMVKLQDCDMSLTHDMFPI